MLLNVGFRDEVMRRVGLASPIRHSSFYRWFKYVLCTSYTLCVYSRSCAQIREKRLPYTTEMNGADLRR